MDAMDEILGFTDLISATTAAEEAATTEELTEKILWIHASHATLLGKTSFTPGIVYSTFIGIRQNLVCMRHLLKEFRIATFIGM